MAWRFPSRKERVDLLEEQLQVVRGLWLPDRPFSFSGQHYQLSRSAGSRPLDTRRFCRSLSAVEPTRGACCGWPRSYADEYVITLASPEQCRDVHAPGCITPASRSVTVRLALFTPVCVADTDAPRRLSSSIKLVRNRADHGPYGGFARRLDHRFGCPLP